MPKLFTTLEAASYFASAHATKTVYILELSPKCYKVTMETPPDECYSPDNKCTLIVIPAD